MKDTYEVKHPCVAVAVNGPAVGSPITFSDDKEGTLAVLRVHVSTHNRLPLSASSANTDIPHAVVEYKVAHVRQSNRCLIYAVVNGTEDPLRVLADSLRILPKVRDMVLSPDGEAFVKHTSPAVYTYFAGEVE